MMCTRIVCPECNGDCGWESSPDGYDPRNGNSLTHQIDCRYCGATGEVEVEVSLIDLDDIPSPFHSIGELAEKIVDRLARAKIEGRAA
jgi:hypothetical protein